MSMIPPFYKPKRAGYTLIELIVAVGLFALVMTLSSGAYLLMVDLSRQSQGVTTGINSLSFALETMTRSIRTGTAYSCGDFGGDCSGDDSFSFKDSSGANITYAFGEQGANGSVGAITKNGIILTDPSVDISALTFYVSGTGTVAAGDYAQPHVIIIVSGTVSSGPKKAPQTFAIETGATMRGIDLNIASAPVENPPSPTCTLLADPPSILLGGASALTWTTAYATSFSIDQSAPPTSPASGGSVSVSPSVTTTYTGTVTNAAGSGTCSAQVAVQ
ncbi:prepilin-type N-terminal cleavage/methylation domain-containing protein [Candidatus Kaiserbacteria bacterium]|nr:prepilin-type N-terminal cleavage/methylation domain-containing protein [Candidatus Kaiserbacteria bacterium]